MIKAELFLVHLRVVAWRRTGEYEAKFHAFLTSVQMCRRLRYPAVLLSENELIYSLNTKPDRFISILLSLPFVGVQKCLLIEVSPLKLCMLFSFPASYLLHVPAFLFLLHFYCCSFFFIRSNTLSHASFSNTLIMSFLPQELGAKFHMRTKYQLMFRFPIF